MDVGQQTKYENQPGLVRITNLAHLQALEVAFEDKLHTDLELVCADKTLFAHRVVVASASKFLGKVMLSIPLTNITVCLPDMSSASVQKLLDCIYKGEAEFSLEQLADLDELDRMLGLGLDLNCFSLVDNYNVPEVVSYSEPVNESSSGEIVIIAQGPDQSEQVHISAEELSVLLGSDGGKIMLATETVPSEDGQELMFQQVIIPDMLPMGVAAETETGESFNEVETESVDTENAEHTDSVVPAGVRHHECQFCKKLFPSQYSLKCHERIHTGEKPYGCSVCLKRFTFKSNWKQHQIAHITGQRSRMPAKTIPCEICHKLFRCWSALVTHKRSHTGDRPFACNICGKGFAVKSNCKKHELLHSSGKLDKPREGNCLCSICGKSFKSQTYLRVHLKMHGTVKPYQCVQCGKTFNFSSNLASHEKLHHGKTPSSESRRRSPKAADVIQRKQRRKMRCYQCDVCQKKFFSKSNLFGHSRVHAVNKEYECQICGKRFTYNSNCKKHEQLHKKWDKRQETTEKPKTVVRVVCDICHKSFSPSHLRVHKRLHTGEKPYQCRYCVRSFTFSSNCSKHEKLHLLGRHVRHKNENGNENADGLQEHEKQESEKMSDSVL